MEKKKWELLKAPIMAVVVVAGMMPGIPTYSNRFLFYIALVVPFLPIFAYSNSSDESGSTVIVAFCYFIGYIIFNVIMVHQIKKIGAQWSKEEYKSLKPDMVTFPFIIVMALSSAFHFLMFYLICISFIK